MWAMRIVHEADLHEDNHGNCFVTLTYQDPHEATDEQYRNGYYLPSPPTLVKSHVQKFIKRLRKKFPQKIRYFYCGEYGDQSRRPHYHLCLFNVSFRDQQLWKDDDGVYTFYSETLQSLWPYGFTTAAELNFETAAYTARYCLKKVTGHNAERHYYYPDDDGTYNFLLPEYVNMSLKPGIGADYFNEYQSDFYRDTVPVPGKGRCQKIPRYYQTILESQFPDRAEEIKRLRKVFYQEHREDFTPKSLMDKYKVTKARLAQQRRAL